MKKDEFILYDKVEEGINYFLEYRLNEVRQDDKYYIESFIDYIEHLEIKIDRLTRTTKVCNSKKNN